ncbi:NLR family CARD domain-containing protein 3-like [Clupea harengus]|uniref:NLR family CARD domain-containing protein 3-like n=1 Tax=Clupea harengus TaxID=7950 RepID=A0A6P8FF36_CLUHA|nr:NLR family CARD domain-containing protein 3-like [Clupea harengus]
MEEELGGNIRAGERDFYEECVEMSSSLETIPNKQIWFKVHKQERIAVQERITHGRSADGSASELELSEESDSGLNNPDDEIGPNRSTVNKEEISEEEDLQKQVGSLLNAMMEVLQTSDEVDELVLRNTGLTDDLLQSLVAALKQSPSVVSTMNLNLNLISPVGVHSLLELLQSRPQLQSLFLFGNRLGDSGVQMLFTGLADLQTSTNRETGMSLQPQATQGMMTLPPIPHQGPPFVAFRLSELDLGGNGITGDGLRVLATYMRYHSQLRYLALAQTGGAEVTMWTMLFESLKVNTELAHIVLDECNLGDHGAKLFAETLRANVAIKKVDLDGNGIRDSGGSAILDALVSRKQSPLQHLSMEEGNFISTALMVKILQEVQANWPAVQNINLPLLPPTGVMQQ